MCVCCSFCLAYFTERYRMIESSWKGPPGVTAAHPTQQHPTPDPMAEHSVTAPTELWQLRTMPTTLWGTAHS